VDEAAVENLDVSALRRGDATAFACLVRAHQRLVMGLCQSRGMYGPDADDAAAEVFAAVYRALPRFEGRSALSTWVYRIACRVIAKSRRRLRSAASGPLDEPRVDPQATSPIQSAVDDERDRLVWSAVAQLEPRQAMAIELFYRRDWSVQQVAEAMGCPENTVKTLLFRARNRLKAMLPGDIDSAKD
jgi:RNA polymerase sigma-70 factor, ECF subfamily